MSQQTPQTTVGRFGSMGKTWLGILALLVVAGVVAWGYQILEGLIVTGMDNIFSWALYIMLFVFFVGLSAGGLIISSVPKFFHSDRYKPIATLGVLISFACIVVAGLLILPDIGRPLRVYQFFTSPDFRSPMVWDFAIVVIYGLFTLGYLWLLTRRDLAARGSRLAFGAKDTEEGRKRDKKLSFWAAAVAIPLAVGLHSITGWIFATQIGRGDWFSPLVAPMFIMKALVSGLALVLVVSILADRYTRFELPRDLIPELGKVLGVFIAVHIIYLVGAERLPHAWAADFEFWAITSGFLVGETAYFWLWTVIGGVVPLALLLVPSVREKTWAVLTASVFAIAGILFEGVNLVFTGYDELYIDAAPGVTTGTDYVGMTSNIWSTVGNYTPTVVELLISVGFVALGALIVTLGLRYLPIQSATVLSGAEDAPAQDGAVADGGPSEAEE